VPQYLIGDAAGEHEAEVRALGDGTYEVTVDGRTVTVDACAVEHSVWSFIVEGDCYEVHASRHRDRYRLLIGGEHHELTARNSRVRGVFSTGAGVVTGRQVVHAPMPGRVARILANLGDVVTAGQPLLTLEAMKMENQLRSPIDGTVVEIQITEGQVVATGEKLVVVE
jgi:biotin carboxyl carrier protein